MKSTRRERRDLILIILILPIGILCMLEVGQIAIRMLPSWNINADMGSKVDPNKQYASLQEVGAVEPLLPAIQTPPAWRDTFLTPQAGQKSNEVVPLSTFDPSVTPSPTANLSQTAVVSPTAVASSTPLPTNTTTTIPTSVTVTATSSGIPPTASATKTKKPRSTDNPPPTNPVTATSTATATTTNTSTSTATSTATALPPVTSTPVGTQLTATPAGFNVGAPDGGSAEGNGPGGFPDGSYFVATLNTPVHVNATPDGNYDMTYSEVENPPGGGSVAMDQVVVGISQNSSGNPYYEVFNWGDGKPDKNTNVDTSNPAVGLGSVATEADNAPIPTSKLDGTPPTKTGILIDVDTAPSHPPEGDYNYVVVSAPPASAPNNSGDGSQVDAIQVTEVPIP